MPQAPLTRSASIRIVGSGRPKSDQIWQWGSIETVDSESTVSTWIRTRSPFFGQAQWFGLRRGGQARAHLRVDAPAVAPDLQLNG